MYHACKIICMYKGYYHNSPSLCIHIRAMCGGAGQTIGPNLQPVASLAGRTLQLLGPQWPVVCGGPHGPWTIRRNFCRNPARTPCGSRRAKNSARYEKNLNYPNLFIPIYSYFLGINKFFYSIRNSFLYSYLFNI